MLKHIKPSVIMKCLSDSYIGQMLPINKLWIEQNFLTF